ncbi:hypothetical protein LS482_03410 [Sinomicrobium kalidii]|uniref:hypothetical protein n=1 Tax=Sinomicrobium kalidii TaxID=2900738 RepID=UPI001E2BAEE9|nr:hypothetical protein [Sinomicrobium kalidii]UGU16928.1 hypothetical protein LS482_03410 [Sinomicrobium kalidii]
MKHGFLILALVICLKPAYPFLEYAANYDYISKVLCINKEKPEMQCYGKCYLMSAVKAEAEDDHRDKPIAKFESQLLYFQNTEEHTPARFVYAPQTANTYHSPEHYTSLFGENPFKPPISLL